MMKKIILTCLVLCFGQLMLLGQKDSEVLKRSFVVNDNSSEFWFCVCNITGDVEVEAYDGSTIEVEVNKQVSGRSQADVAEGMESLQLVASDGDGFAKVLMISSQQELEEKDDPLACSWNWRHNSSGRPDYRYRLDYKVKVPKGISVKVSTVNDGELWVKNVGGNIYASNVNGDVTLAGVKGNTKANTVNGRVEVEYLEMPNEFASFKTVNGDIELFAPNNVSGVFNFESQWGKIYSDFDFDEKVAPKMTKVKEGDMTRFKVANSNGYKIGQGGPEMAFETLNGNIKIRKRN